MTEFIYALANIDVSLTPEATCSHGTPRHVVGSGGFGGGGAGVIRVRRPRAVSVVADVSESGFFLRGAGVLTTATPSVVQAVGAGGFLCGGDGAYGKVTATRPRSKSIVGSKGFVLGGAGVFTCLRLGAVPFIHLVGSGGLALGGEGTVTVTRTLLKRLAGSGGFLLGEFRLPPVTISRPTLTKTVGKPAAFTFGGQGLWAVSRAGRRLSIVSTGGGFGLVGEGAASSRRPRRAHILGEGGFILSGEGQSPVYETWVLSGNDFGASFYFGFDFNSFCFYQGRFYGAKDDGIHQLDADDDNGEAIHSGVRIGPTNLGVAAFKRLRRIVVGECGEEAQVRIKAGDRERVFPVVQGRAVISRDLQDRELLIDIADFDALSHVEIFPLVLSRR